MRWYLRENVSFLNFTQQKKMFAFSNLTFLLKYFSLCLLLIMVLLHLPIHCNPMVEKNPPCSASKSSGQIPPFHFK